MFSLEVLLQTPNSASVSGENGKSLAPDMKVANCIPQERASCRYKFFVTIGLRDMEETCPKKKICEIARFSNFYRSAEIAFSWHQCTCVLVYLVQTQERKD